MRYFVEEVLVLKRRRRLGENMRNCGWCAQATFTLHLVDGVCDGPELLREELGAGLLPVWICLSSDIPWLLCGTMRLSNVSQEGHSESTDAQQVFTSPHQNVRPTEGVVH